MRANQFQHMPDAANPSGHVFCHVQHVLPGRVLADLNLKDTSFLQTKDWSEVATAEITKWRTRWRLPMGVLPRWETWIDQQLRSRESLLNAQHQHGYPDIESGLSALQGLVITPADHFPRAAHVACPFAFDLMRCLMGLSWALTCSSSVVCGVGAQSILANLRFEVLGQQGWQTQYGWTVTWAKPLPGARVLPKPSKKFTKARPIIACDMCWRARLTTFLARALYQIRYACFPSGSTFNIDSTLTAMRHMWSMMQVTLEPSHLVQQDLVGFCNSVPHDRILKSLLTVCAASTCPNRRCDKRTRISASFADPRGLQHVKPQPC